jgi:hypothetical protein
MKWINIECIVYEIGEILAEGGCCLVAWEKTTKPKSQGGLSIIDLRANNIALLIKFLHKFYNKANLPWMHLTWADFYSRHVPPRHRKKVGSFWWSDIISILDHFFIMAACEAQEKRHILFLEGYLEPRNFVVEISTIVLICPK